MIWYVAAGSALGGMARYLMAGWVQRTIHSDRVLRLSVDLPIVVECVDTDEKIQSVIPTIDEMMGGGLITLEKANVIIYRPEHKC